MQEFAFRIHQQPKADAGVREAPGAAGETSEDAGELRGEAARPGGRTSACPGGHDPVLRGQAPGEGSRAGPGEEVVLQNSLLLILLLTSFSSSEIYFFKMLVMWTGIFFRKPKRSNLYLQIFISIKKGPSGYASFSICQCLIIEPEYKRSILADFYFEKRPWSLMLYDFVIYL